MNPIRPDETDPIFDAKIRSILDRLSDDQIPVPSRLEARIRSFVRTPNATVEGLLNDFIAEPPSRRRLAFNRLADFVATAAAVVFVVSAILLSSGYIRQQSRKALCAENLGVLGSAVAAYANDYYNQLPYAQTGADDRWYDPASNRPKRIHLFILVKGNYVSPQYLLCPEDSDKINTLVIRNVSALHDFPRGFVVSYSFQNLNGEPRLDPSHRQLRWSKAQTMAIMADRTPLLIKDQLKSVLDQDDLASANHARLKGQNILTLDGRVIWQKTPVFGPQRDNIWKAGNIRQYSGKEIPADSLDSFLAP